SRKPIVRFAVATPTSPSAFRHTLEKSSLASQVAQALKNVRGPQQLRGDQSQRGLAHAALAVDDRVLSRLGDDREEIGDLLRAPGEEVSPIDRRRRAEGLSHSPHPIQEICLIHSRPLHDQRKPTIAPVRDEWEVPADLTDPNFRTTVT